MGKTAVFTIVSLNYGAYARTLMDSVRTVHPDWDRYVMLVDRCDDPASVGGELFTTLQVEELPLPKKEEFLFRYDIMELNTAVKPYTFAELRRRGYERLVYIDPDILVLQPLEDVVRLLDEGASAVVTPHLTAPLTDDKRPTELDIMRAGSYNLGFLALQATPAADAFIAWWQDKLEHGAVSDPDRGLFTDQKWVDLAPGMFGGFAVLRDPGYNVAYWNLQHRPVTFENDVWLAGGRPIRFFHFSGFDPVNPKRFSKHQDRYTLDTIGPARELALQYAGKVLAHDFVAFRARPYAFGSFDSGVPIPAAIRVLYREDGKVRFAAGANPFAADRYFINGESENALIVMRALWLQHKHLQRAFPEPLGASREAYCRWMVENGAAEIGLPQAFLEQVRVELSQIAQDAETHAPMPLWGRGLAYLHRRATGRRPGTVSMIQYRKVTGPVKFFEFGLRQFRGTRWARYVGMQRESEAAFDPMDALAVGAGKHQAGAVKRWRSDRFSGLYREPGKDMWWAGLQAALPIDEYKGPQVRIVGVHPGDMHQRAHGHSQMRVSIGVGNGLHKQITLEPGAFDITLDLQWLPEGLPAVLRIVPEHTFVPAESGLGDDRRRLSFLLSRVESGGCVLFDAAEQAAHASGMRAAAVPGVNAIGYARSEHGLGQSLRQFVLALDAGGIAADVIDFNHNNLSRVEDTTLAERLVTEPSHRINVFHINADQMPEVELHMPAQVQNRYNIGFWHWELPEMLDEHFAGFKRLNEVWAPTAFVQDAVAKCSPIPVVRMPHAIEFAVSPGASRAQFGLPEGKFLFLMMYDFSSYQERKNPRAALAAFEQAFGRDEEQVALVIKTQNAAMHEHDLQALREAIGERRNVIWINETLTRQQVYDLQAVCDCLVSLHRSEGFGLGPAESMFLGKPVIATNWSGNIEFMRQDNSLPVDYRLITIAKDVGVYRAGQTWADPDVAHAAALMRRISTDSALRERISAEARRTMREEFSPQAIGRRIRDRLAFIQQNLL